MSYGLLNEDGSAVFDEIESPWSRMKTKTWKSTNKELGFQIICRFNVYDFGNVLAITAPCPSQWKTP